MQKRNLISYTHWATGIFLLTVAFFVFPTTLSAKGNFARITVQAPDSDPKIVLTDAAYRGFFAFSDFTEGTRLDRGRYHHRDDRYRDEALPETVSQRGCHVGWE